MLRILLLREEIGMVTFQKGVWLKVNAWLTRKSTRSEVKWLMQVQINELNWAKFGSNLSWYVH